MTFSPLIEGRLLTSGTGHIRFWKMASTFTGLKLQGDIGKFGNVELSDISAYCELPDGRVISGSESGNMLMWDGNLIQFSIMKSENEPCHKGPIEFITLEDGVVITAGQDGFICHWDFKQIEFAEVSEESMYVYIQPDVAKHLAPGVKIMGMLRGDDHWIVQDANGGIWQVWIPSLDQPKKLMDVHAGAITCVNSCPYDAHIALTGGMDGTVRVWDIIARENTLTRRFSAGVTSICWAPVTVDPTQSIVYVGFDDGVLRVLKRYATSFKLVKTVKPHTKAITDVKVSPDGIVIVTASKDKTLFFLCIEGHGQRFSPLGFVTLSHPGVSLNWSPDSKFVMLASGPEVLQYSKPQPEQYVGSDSTRDTFAIELPCRRYKPKIEYTPDDVDSDWDDQPEPEEGEEKRPLLPPARVTTYPEDNISAILPGLQNNQFFITLEAPDGEKYPGIRFESLYECNFVQEEPVASIPLQEGMGTVSYLGYSHSKQYILIGSANGGVQMRPLTDLEFFFIINPHDGDNGLVTQVVTTFDERFLISTGQDGNFFAHAVDMESALAKADRPSMEKLRALLLFNAGAAQRERDKRRKERVRKAEIAEAIEKGDEPPEHPDEPDPKAPFSKSDAEKMLAAMLPKPVQKSVVLPAVLADDIEPQNETDFDAPDITDAATYSIEEAKLKQEEDDRMMSADKKKEVVRAEIQELRKEFQFMLKKNSALETSQQLGRDAFELDPKLREQLEKDAQDKIAQVERELAWVSEKHDIALKKLRDKFLGDLIVEHIRLRSFRTNTTVTCFRTPELPPFLREAIQQVHEMIDTEEKNRREKDVNFVNNSAGADGEADDGLGSNRSVSGAGGVGGKKGAAVPRAKDGKAKTKGGKKNGGEAETRKKARAERKKQLEKLKASKPDKNVDDPADVQAVQYAERNMGDYKLKSDPNYVVPEHQRVDANRKRRQMVLLQESVHFIKMGFNERFLAMRDLKARIVKNIKKDNVRLAALNEKLGFTDQSLYEPELDSSEWPEHRELYTKEDIEAFQKEKMAGKGGKGGGGGAGAAAAPAPAAPVADEKEEKKGTTKVGGAVAGAVGTATAAAATKDPAKAAAPGEEKILTPFEIHEERLAMIPKSELELAEEKVARHLLEHERTTLLEKIDFAIWTFDQALAKLRREKFKLDTDLKTTDLKVLTLYQELYLLKDFEENENLLFAKLNKARVQKVQVVADKTECEKQLHHKLAEIKAWQEKDKQVMADFNQVVGGEKSEFYPQLLKIFKKKVKRNKKKGGRDNEDEEEGSDDEDDYGSDESGSDSEDSDSEDDDDSCPMHCDSAIYEKVVELREKRLEQEEYLQDYNKQCTALNQTYVVHTNKEKNIDKELEKTEADIEQFQSEKQRALNQIEVTIPLKLSQMRYLENSKLPADISNALIFTSTGLGKLRNRIVELQNEKIALSKQFKDLRRGHKVLKKENSSKRELIAVEQKRCEDVQMLKFGQIIDLSILAKVGVDEGAAELRRKLKNLEAGSVQKLNEWDKKIHDAKDDLAKITSQNTRWLERVANLTKAQYDLEDQLNNTTKNVHVADTSPIDEKSDSDRRQLLQLVHIQEKEIDALKAEIHVLRRKGGHVYTPSS